MYIRKITLYVTLFCVTEIIVASNNEGCTQDLYLHKSISGCESICHRIGASTEFFERDKLCICMKPNQVSEADLEQYKKEAKTSYDLTLILKDSEDPIVGQINSNIYDQENHHNLIQDRLTPAITRTLLQDAHNRLQNLIHHTNLHPYNRQATIRETEAIRNSLRQITQVNVNVRPDEQQTPFWGFVNRLVPQILGAPNPSLDKKNLSKEQKYAESKEQNN